MALFDKALRIGEGKKFKEFEKNVARINDFEPELELESDEELRARYDALRERALDGESLDDLLFESLRAHARGGQAHARPAPLRRPADRRHGAARRLDRRDEDRRGQDAHRHAADRAERAHLARRGRQPGARQGRPPGHGQRLPGPPRRALDEADLRPAGRSPSASSSPSERDWDEKRAAYEADVTYGTNSEFGFDYLRDNLATDVAEKSQRGHGFAIVDEVDNILIDEARTPLIISGAARAGRRPLLQVRQARPDDGAGQEARGPRGASPRATSPTSTSSPTRSTRPWRSPSAASRRPRSSSASTTCTRPSTATSSTTSSRR